MYAGFAMLLVLLVHLPGEAEIDDFDVALAVDEDVRGLQVAMHNVAALLLAISKTKYLQIEKTAEHLVHDGANVALAPVRDAFRVTKKAVKVPPAIFLPITLPKKEDPTCTIQRLL